MRPRSPKLLWDIAEAARFIAEDTAGLSYDAYRADRRARQTVGRNFTIMGEAMRRLSDHDPETADRLTGRAQVVAFRNVLVRAYDDLDHDRVWEVVRGPLPVLLAEVDALLAEADAG